MADNCSQTLCQELRDQSTGIIVTETWLVTAIMFVTIIGNSLVISSVVLHKDLRSKSNLIIASLAVPDLLMGFMNMPMDIIVLVKRYWPFDDSTCKWAGFNNMFVAAVSTLHLGLIAIQRFYKVVHHQQHDKLFTNTRIFVAVVAIWIVSGLLALCPVLGFGTYEFNYGLACCLVTFDKSNIHFMFFYAAIGTLLPFVIIIYCYYRIYAKIRKHLRQLKDEDGDVNVTSEVSVSKIVLVVVTTYFTLWSPVPIIISLTLVNVEIPRWFYFVTLLFILFSSMVNPIIYGLMNKQFRRGFRNVLDVVTRRKRLSQVSMTGLN